MRQVSASALKTARAILKEYKLEVRTDNGAVGMTATEGHVAIVIDYATNVYKVAELRPELNWWQRQITAKQASAPQLAGFLKKLREAFQQVPQYTGKELEARKSVVLDLPPEYAASVAAPRTVPLSKSSSEVIRFLKHYYTITRCADGGFDPPADYMRIAQLAELTLGLNHAMKAMQLAEVYLDKLKQGQATEKEVRVCFKNIGVLLGSLPMYYRAQEEMLTVN